MQKDERIERVAKAIADDCDDTWDKLLPEQKDHFRCNAIAAIRALEASQAGEEQVLRDALKSAAESLHHAGCYVAEAEALAALTTPNRIEAAPFHRHHPLCAIQKGGRCDYDCARDYTPTAQAAEIKDDEHTPVIGSNKIRRTFKKPNNQSSQAAQPQEAVTQVFEARHCPGIPTDCCDFGVISHATGKEVCRVWDRDDAELIARLFNATPPQAAESGLLDEAVGLFRRLLEAMPADTCLTDDELPVVQAVRAFLAKAGKPQP